MKTTRSCDSSGVRLNADTVSPSPRTTGARSCPSRECGADPVGRPEPATGHAEVGRPVADWEVRKFEIELLDERRERPLHRAGFGADAPHQRFGGADQRSPRSRRLPTRGSQSERSKCALAAYEFDPSRPRRGSDELPDGALRRPGQRGEFAPGDGAPRWDVRSRPNHIGTDGIPSPPAPSATNSAVRSPSARVSSPTAERARSADRRPGGSKRSEGDPVPGRGRAGTRTPIDAQSRDADVLCSDLARRRSDVGSARLRLLRGSCVASSCDEFASGVLERRGRSFLGRWSGAARRPARSVRRAGDRGRGSPLRRGRPRCGMRMRRNDRGAHVARGPVGSGCRARRLGADARAGEANASWEGRSSYSSATPRRSLCRPARSTCCSPASG